MKKLLLILAALAVFTPVFAQVAPAPPDTAAMICANNTVIPTPTSGKFFYVQCDSSGKLITSGSGPTLATSNLVFSVTPAGSDTNVCSTGSPCATPQRALTVAAQYDYQYLYYPTINIAHGTYMATTGKNLMLLPSLVHLLPGQNGQIIGDNASAASVILQDNGTQYIVQDSSNAQWTFSGVNFAGTYGAIVQNGPWSSIGLNVYRVSGNFAQTVFNMAGGAGSTFSGIGSAGTITSTALGGNLFFGRQFILWDTANITFANAVTVHGLIAIDDQYSGFYFFNSSFTNGSNVTSVGNALVMSNWARFETNGTGSTVDGVALSRSNFPGNGSGIYVDVWSQFGPDLTPFYGNIGTNAGSVALIGTDGILYADYGVSGAGTWSFNGSTGNININGNASHHPGFLLSDHFDSGEDWLVSSGLTTNCLSTIELTTGNFFTPWVSCNQAWAFNPTTVFGFSAAAGSGTLDTGFSRLAAASVALGNGTAGDFSGTLKLAHVTATALANTATTSAVCYNVATGVLTYDGTVGTCTTSDERLKEIGPRIDHALDRLLKINGFHFTWKDPTYGTGPQIGVGAQTVEKVFPELVSTGSDGNKSVDYVHMVAPIIEAMRELKADNDNLRACQENWRCRLFGTK